MAVTIRLSRTGRANRPFWRVVVMDSRKKRDGAYLDNVGTYDPLKHAIVQLNVERIEDWMSKGATISPTVKKLVKMHKKTKKTES